MDSYRKLIMKKKKKLEKKMLWKKLCKETQMHLIEVQQESLLGPKFNLTNTMSLL